MKLRVERLKPVLLYDDTCRICSTIAKLASKWSRSRIKTVGQYTEEGGALKALHFREEDRPEEMFWMIVHGACYGGRSGIPPLLAEIVRGMLVGG